LASKAAGTGIGRGINRTTGSEPIPKLEDPIEEEFLQQATLRRLGPSNREQNADGATGKR
jgi:hypothetical protein